jgi:hypothetical protein
MTPTKPTCSICGEPMPEGEGMFKFHGYSGPCPKPPKPQLLPHMQRVVEEKAALDEKLVKLLKFLQTSTFNELTEAERSRLRQQVRFMDGYSAVLKERIAAF